MMRQSHSHLMLAACFALLPIGCGLDVREDESGGRADVEVRTPVGGVSVRTNGEIPDTGLPAYPRARASRDDDSGNADVRVSLPFVDVKVAASNFEHDDAPEAILAFYRTEMRKYGDVVECRGDI